MAICFKKYPKYYKNRGFQAVYTYKKAMDSFKSVFAFFPILTFSRRQNKGKMHLCAVAQFIERGGVKKNKVGNMHSLSMSTARSFLAKPKVSKAYIGQLLISSWKC